jgi:hypothetical protein
MKSRYFILGFGASVLVFVALNLLAAHLRSDCGLPAILGLAACADDIRRAGFPFLFWEEGGFAYRSNFYLTAFLADIALALILSLLAGLGLRWWRANRVQGR